MPFYATKDALLHHKRAHIVLQYVADCTVKHVLLQGNLPGCIVVMKMKEGINPMDQCPLSLLSGNIPQRS